MAAALRIGIDFDNTLITYDHVFLTIARERGLASATFSGRKQAIRDSIRLLPHGELSWQQLQGQVYGKGVAGAAMFDGVDSFLRRSQREGVSVVIVSHKTEYGHHDPERVSLRKAALDWMTVNGFFLDSGYAIPPTSVYFEATREEKIARIAQLGCTHFIDDLEEVLTDPAFPRGVERILFAEDGVASGAEPFVVCPTWRHIEERVFRARK